MVIILPLALVLFWICQLLSGKKPVEAWLGSVVSWCILLFLQTEIMSLFCLITPVSVFLFWLVVCVCASGAAVRLKVWKKMKVYMAMAGDALHANRFLAGIFLVIGCLSLMTVPYNWDSMTYHIPRITHWVQNQSVAHYGTNVIRQISSPVMHEFVGLHVYLLSGKRDVFLNLIQFGAFVTNACLIYGIAEKIGCERKFRKIAILLFCSMPIAFGEALTTQNDHFAGMWLFGFLYCLLDLLHRDQKLTYDKATVSKCMMMTACVGFGYLTKPSVCIGMLFLAVVLLAVCVFKKDSPIVILKLICTVVPVLAILILPEILRNLVTFHSIMHSGAGARQLVGTIDPRYLLVNGLKNFAFNMPNILVPQSSRWIVTMINRIALLLKVDINSPGISEDGRIFSLGAAGDYGHDTAVNALVVFMAVISFLWCLYRSIRFRSISVGKCTGVVKDESRQVSFQRQYTYIVFALMVMFCAVVRWEPFVSRYMLPYLALLCPMIAVQIQDFSQNVKSEMWRGAAVPVMCCFCISQLSMLLFYHLDIARRQEERPAGYFYNRMNIKDAYLEACNFVIKEQYSYIGLIIGADSYEYPIYSMLDGSVDRIEHVAIGNESNMYEDMDYIPDCILVTGAPDYIISQDVIEVHESKYTKSVFYEEIAVYVK